MKRTVFILIFLIGSSVAFLHGSTSTGRPDTAAVLEKLFRRLAGSTADSLRIRINDSIMVIIDSYAESDSVMRHKFENIRFLGQITSPDSKLKIITWNLLLSGLKSRYYCYFINRSGKTNKVYKLTGMYREEPARTDTAYTQDNWYGALYYDLRPVRQGNQIYWMLLGIDYGNPVITRKIIDVLSFNPDNSLILGKKWFETGKETKYREVLEYNSSAVITLRFLSDKSIVFDHLVSVSPDLKGKKEYYGPDYSYDSFNFEKGSWKLKINIDVRNKE
ncbi:MAG: hypothetical protein Q8868_10450 [Bacteroidota bacterium]|nr:hypothetical protein [Bacteroidota bacterium]